MSKKYFLPFIIIILVAIAAAIIVPVVIQANSAAEISDTAAFKAEYESLNGTTRESDGATYQSITIPSDADIKYLTVAEAADLVRQGTGVLYVGANWCPWCRNAVPELLAAAKAYGERTLYYVNLDNDKSIYKVEDGQLVQTQPGSIAYHQLLDLLESQLDDYSIASDDADDDTSYATGEKRIYIPYVVAVKNGVILSDHTGTVTLDADQTAYDPLTAAQSQELLGIYTAMFAEVYGSTCDEHSATPCD